MSARETDRGPVSAYSENVAGLDDLVAVLAPLVAEHIEARDELLGVDQAAELMHTTSRWLRDQARAGRVPHRRHGKAYVFSRGDLLAWSEARSRGPRRGREGSGPSLRSVGGP